MSDNDLNKDGFVNIQDITFLLSQIKKLDKTGDGIVDLSDIKSVLQDNLAQILGQGDFYEIPDFPKRVLIYHFRAMMHIINEISYCDVSGDGMVDIDDVDAIVKEVYGDR